MGVWIPAPRLEPDEQVRWQGVATRSRGRRRPSGGRLYLTSRRLVFMPSRLDSFYGAHPWAAPLSAVRGVGVQPRGGKATRGGLRDRLRLDFDDGPELFVIVRHLNTAVAMLHEATAQPYG